MGWEQTSNVRLEDMNHLPTVKRTAFYRPCTGPCTNLNNMHSQVYQGEDVWTCLRGKSDPQVINCYSLHVSSQYVLYIFHHSCTLFLICHIYLVYCQFTHVSNQTVGSHRSHLISHLISHMLYLLYVHSYRVYYLLSQIKQSGHIDHTWFHIWFNICNIS